MHMGDEYRSRADQCERLAAQLRRPEQRAVALHLAEAWTKLAEWVDRKSSAMAAHPHTEPDK